MRNFDVGELERQYAYLDEVPEELVGSVVSARGGAIREIAGSVAFLRRALLEGELPAVDDLAWPERKVREAALETLEALDIARFCEGQPELADSLLESVLEAIETGQIELAASTEERLKELALLEKRNRLRDDLFEVDGLTEQEQKALEALEPDDVPEWLDKLEPSRVDELVELNPETLDELRQKARDAALQEASDNLAEALLARWADLADAWHEVARVFTRLSGMLGRGWDYAHGLVQMDGWLDLAAMREFVEDLPELQELIRTLGRMQISDDDEEPVAELVFESMRRRGERVEMRRTPHAPMETRGVRRSDDITRMLPVEALNLTQPRLKKLFHARRFEHALATYRVEGVMPEHIEVEEDIEEEIEREDSQPKNERGPIIVCLDTSGSMHGTPERVAKALTLEAVRVAHQEGRRCFVYAFSGPGQVEEREISLEREALGEFIAFLRRSFHGGTDVDEPLRRAVDRLAEENWEKADMLMVSDGEFPVPGRLESSLDAAREERGAKLHGVLIGSRTASMEALCDEVHRFSEWDTLARCGRR